MTATTTVPAPVSEAPRVPYVRSENNESWCRHAECHDLWWGGTPRRHLRGSQCPPLPTTDRED